MTALVLASLAVLLSGPVPAFLARVTRVRATPRSAMVLWQAVALAAVLAALGAPAALSTDRVLDGEVTAGDVVVAGLALIVTAVVLGRLLLRGHVVGTRLRERRRAHREAVELLGSPGEDVVGPAGAGARVPRRTGVVVLEGPAPTAYCLPALRGHRIVISRGAAELLTAPQLAAVVAHERAHLVARHDLVLEAFTVLHQAFPRVVQSSRALAEVRLLVEVLADADARRHHGARPLAEALVALAGARPPGAALAAGGDAAVLTTRVRLLGAGAHPVQAGLLCLASAAVLALPTTFVVLPWLASLR